MKRAITGLIFALVVSGAVLAAEMKQFPHSADWSGWLRVDYPARFELDPKSFQGEAKWWAKFNDKDSGLSFEVGAFGYVNDLDLVVTIPGVNYENYQEKLSEEVPVEQLISEKAMHKNIGGYFRAKILPKECVELKFPGYERFISTTKDRVVVYFLGSDAYKKTFGRCYQTLTFTFPEGTYERHKKDIDAIILSAKPPYENPSERDGDRQPATHPKSK